MEQVVKVAGQRWQIEQGFQLAKGECGLDHYQVRKWQAWYRHLRTILIDARFLGSGTGKGSKKNTARDELVALTAPQIRHLLCWLLLFERPLAPRVLHWSRWRRRHQKRAQKCHYRKRNASPP